MSPDHAESQDDVEALKRQLMVGLFATSDICSTITALPEICIDLLQSCGSEFAMYTCTVVQLVCQYQCAYACAVDAYRPHWYNEI